MKSWKHHRKDADEFHLSSPDELRSFDWRVEAESIVVCILFAVVALIGFMHVIDWMLGG